MTSPLLSSLPFLRNRFLPCFLVGIIVLGLLSATGRYLGVKFLSAHPGRAFFFLSWLLFFLF